MCTKFNLLNYDLIKDTIDLMQAFDKHNQNAGAYTNDIQGFKEWIANGLCSDIVEEEPVWEGKEKGRSAESAINTLLVHMNRYAKNYSKSAIHNSDLSTQEDFIYLINLKAFGPMGKIELIKKNIQDKSAGMQIINRLIDQGWADQTESEKDKRSRVVRITEKGLNVLEKQMNKIRQASQLVTGSLTYKEKMELIRLLGKLNDFHHPIYCQNSPPSELLDSALAYRKQITAQ